ncbi:threonine/serine exporter family protein [Clostridium botulinum]|nr:threonine/serine exporter family protein [Clostridium botulinum]MCS4466118.1 threonine/serine exporter family protein [Clostridium botulinum]MCS4478809.1 threonine/serine exporter family protein [Clostridium botulinum]MCS4526952.1 threonine/serine exporter family protein [Clostridium botulinum]
MRKESNIKKCIGYMLAASGFAVFFGGTFLDGLVAAVIAIAIFGMDHFFKFVN